ncbi:hypothetical protein BDZ91DRAFT_710300 [Kalaharituber pfeilii]|nr:hypothetical protein BDZ91DRAFT_710300 [Kalaharituber pfeilii]
MASLILCFMEIQDRNSRRARVPLVRGKRGNHITPPGGMPEMERLHLARRQRTRPEPPKGHRRRQRPTNDFDETDARDGLDHPGFP